MTRILTKDEIAEVYLRQQRSLFMMALTYTHSMYAAEEIVGDTIVALLEAEAEFKNEGACAVYMRTIVRHKAISMFRKKYTVEPQDDESIEREFIERNQMERPYNEVEIQLLIRELLQSYSKEIQEAFIAYVLDQVPVQDLAEMYGLSYEALRKQFQRIKARIAEKIPEKEMRAFLFTLLLYL